MDHIKTHGETTLTQQHYEATEAKLKQLINEVLEEGMKTIDDSGGCVYQD